MLATHPSEFERGYKLVSPHDTNIIEQLTGDKAEKVHPVEKTVADFTKMRLGSIDNTRQSWVRLNAKGEITAALYTARSDSPVLRENDLPGNIAKILETPSKIADRANPRAIVFYSISSFEQGAGQSLIQDVHGYLWTAYATRPWLSTLSPLRAPENPKANPDSISFGGWLKRNFSDAAEIAQNETRLKDMALTYLSLNIHSVEKFHLGNGGYIGDIKLGCNKADSEDFREAFNCMANYVYSDKETLTKNAAAYKEKRTIFVAPHLYERAKRLKITDGLALQRY